MERAQKAYGRLGFEARELQQNVAFSGNAWVLEAKHKGMEQMQLMDANYDKLFYPKYSELIIIYDSLIDISYFMYQANNSVYRDKYPSNVAAWSWSYCNAERVVVIILWKILTFTLFSKKKAPRFRLCFWQNIASCHNISKDWDDYAANTTCP